MDMFDFFIGVIFLGMPALAILLMVCHSPILLVLVFGTLAVACFMTKKTK